MHAPPGWATQQLAEFLAVVTEAGDQQAALQAAVERAAEALEAEVGFAVVDNRLAAAVGFPAHHEPDVDLVAAANGAVTTLEVPGAGSCTVLTTRLSPGGDCLAVARSFGDYETAEVALLHSMARVLMLTLRLVGVLDDERALRELSERQYRENLSLVASLQERQGLLEHLSRIQRSISHRAPLQDVLDAITLGASDLLASLAAIRLIDPTDPSRLVMVSSHGVAKELLDELRYNPLGQGAGGRAAAEDRLVVIDDYARDPDGLAPFARRNLQAAMAAPVHEDGRVVGSIVVARYETGFRYSDSQQEALLALAEHASLALTDAKTVATMREAQEAKDLFLAMVSHELKTPLTVMLGTLKTLQARDAQLSTAVRSELLDAAADRGWELQRLIDRLLQGARAELATTPTKIRLAELVSAAVTGFSQTYQLRVTVVPDETVVVDPQVVGAVLGTLLENATTHASAPPVRVRTAVDKEHVEITIANQGALSPDLDPEDLFKPFLRGPDVASAGVGLGLYIARRQAQSIGGTLDCVVSADEVAFTFRFPASPEVGDGPQPSARPQSPQRQTSPTPPTTAGHPAGPALQARPWPAPSSRM